MNIPDDLRPSSRVDAAVRRLARAQGYALHRSRRGESIDNFGGYMIVDEGLNACVAGSRFDMTARDVADWLST